MHFTGPTPPMTPSAYDKSNMAHGFKGDRSVMIATAIAMLVSAFVKRLVASPTRSDLLATRSSQSPSWG